MLNQRELQPGTNVVQSPPKAGTPLPPGYHLVYMAPASLEDDLGADGTDKTFNPPDTFTRCMWAGGSMAWSKQNPLRIGEDVEEWTLTRLISAVPKTSRSGHEMVLVEIEKELANSNGVALTDRRYAYVSSGAMCRCCLGVFVRFRFEEISRFADNHWFQILDLPTSKRASLSIQRSPKQSKANNRAPLQVRNPRRSVKNRDNPETLRLVPHRPLPFLSPDIQRPHDPLLGPMVSGGRRLPRTRCPRPIEPDQHARLLARRAREWWWRPTTTNLDSVSGSCAVIRGVSVYDRGW